VFPSVKNNHHASHDEPGFSNCGQAENLVLALRAGVPYYGIKKRFNREVREEHEKEI
jgi:hypothetical protein